MGENAHTWAKCTECDGCHFCDGGLRACTVCNGAEVDLPPDCPGVPLTTAQMDAQATENIAAALARRPARNMWDTPTLTGGHDG